MQIDPGLVGAWCEPAGYRATLEILGTLPLAEELERRSFDLEGVIQGIGFRPAVHRLALSAGLGGSVQNRAGKVRLVLEGAPICLDAFLTRLPSKLPEQARIDRVVFLGRERLSPGESKLEFRILESYVEDEARITFPPDLAMCSDCAREVLDPGDRRYGYPFTTCTACGPRYTVINDTPYDRERTTLADFPLCAACRAEYEDIGGRRYHAESIACVDCGPKLWLEIPSGEWASEDILQGTRRRLAGGEILAMRGIGGFLLVLDPRNRESLEILRRRKNRPAKPLALMARDLAAVARYCTLTDAAQRLLLSQEAPIVVLDVNESARHTLPLDLLSPDTETLGMMLPYSPLHLLLFEPLQGDTTPPFDLLVMTSGNRRSEPICITNEEARKRLEGIADFFLFHNRDINLRADDSLTVLQDGKGQIWRRARGFVPDVIKAQRPLRRAVLAMGAELKNTLALGWDDKVVLSSHNGDLETPEALSALEEASRFLPKCLNRQPEVIAVDLHPDMHSTRLGRRIASSQGLETRTVQHHYAHAASLLLEYGLDECLALVFDGVGYGTDGTYWGAELMHARLDGFSRLASFRPVALPGGDAAVREPRRQLAARFEDAGVAVVSRFLEELGTSEDEHGLWLEQIEKGLNAPLTTSAGRLFDSFSAALGFSPLCVNYEGQAAVRLETAAQKGVRGEREIGFGRIEEQGMLWIDWRPAFGQLADCGAMFSRDESWALAVHEAIAHAACAMVEYGISRVPLPIVGLSGGVFMNRLLSTLVRSFLENDGIEVLVHCRIPPNDGGISAGQAYICGG